MSRRRVLLAAAILTAAGAIFGGFALWRASGALHDARQQVAAESSYRFTSRPIVRSLPSGLESIGAPAVFSDAAIFENHLFIAGPAGLAEYDSNGTLIARYRPGAELPAAPVTAVAVGLASDSRAPELWIGTSGEGLVAYDGREFRQIRAEDARFRKITAVLPVSTGRILLGTEKAGVLVYDGRELKPFHSSLVDSHVSALAGDDSSLWIGTIDRGLLHWKAGALETIDETLPDRQILSLAVDGETIYAGTGMGVAEISDGKVARILAPGYFAQSLLVAQSRLWVGTLEEGMIPVSLGKHAGHITQRTAQAEVSTVCPDCSIRKIFQIGGEVYALASDSLWHGSESVIRREDALLVDRNISALKIDSTGRLWVGYFDRGLQILDASGGRGEHFEDDRLFCINRIAHDSARGISAVATANGLVMFDASSRHRVITQSDGLIANQVTDVVLRPDGSAIAATPAGVSFIDASGINSVYAFQGLVNNHVYALASDGSRTLAGTLGGLSILDGTVVRASFTVSNSGLKHNWITAITRPAGEDWFVGTYGAGVLRLTSVGTWETFEDLRGAIEINQNAMTSTAQAVYAGTLDRGLAVYSLGAKRWSFFTSGLPSQNVTAVEARAGVLYIGTDNGLVRVPEAVVVR